MYRWMQERGMKLRFEAYSGQPRGKLMTLVRTYWDKKLFDGEDADEWAEIMSAVLDEGDLKDIVEAQEREGNVAEKAFSGDSDSVMAPHGIAAT